MRPHGLLPVLVPLTSSNPGGIGYVPHTSLDSGPLTDFYTYAQPSLPLRPHFSPVAASLLGSSAQTVRVLPPPVAADVDIGAEEVSSTLSSLHLGLGPK